MNAWKQRRRLACRFGAAFLIFLGACDDDVARIVEALGLSNATITTAGDSGTYGSTDFEWQSNLEFDFEVRIGDDCESGTLIAGAGSSGTVMPMTPVTSTIDATADAAALSEGPNTLHVCLIAGASGVSVLETVVTLDDTPPAAPGGFSILPTGPANDNSPELSGATDAGVEVEVFSDAGCATSLGAATADGSGDFTATLAVADDTTSDLYALSRDAVGNESACTDTAVTYEEDSTEPDPPAFTDTEPASPANDNNPDIEGTAEADSTVTLYSDSFCTTQVGSGSAAGGDFAISVNVADNTSTSFYGTATDAAGNVSSCSIGAISYTEDGQAPNPPSFTGTTPVSPANDNSPDINGAAEADSTVRLYTNNMCTSAVAGTGTAVGGNFSIAVAVTDDTVTTFYATATDAAGNTSSCSTTNASYTEDSTPPDPPTNLDSSPTGPSADTMPEIRGTADLSSTVELFTDAGCTSSTGVTGAALTFGTTGLTVTVGADSTTTFYAAATDVAGNESNCSTANVTYVHNAPPSFDNLPTAIACDLGEAVNFTATATDTDGLTFAEGAGSTCAQTSQNVASGGAVTFTCTPIATDTCTIEVEVDDGVNAPVSANLTVNPENVWFVDGAVGASGNGRTWATAKKTVQEASDAASSGESVWVAAGSYTAASDGASVLSAKAGVDYYGGFASGDDSFDDRDPSTNVTVLEGDRGNDGPDADNSARVVLIDTQPNVRIDGFTIQNGYGAPTGGGVYIAGSTPVTVANSRILDNTASSAGGGIYNGSASNTFIDLHFEGNSVSSSGGGNVYGGALYMVPNGGWVLNSTFINNTASRPSGGQDGGAIYLSGLFDNTDSAGIVNCLFAGNSVPGGGVFGRGGAIASAAGTVTIVNSAFVNNSVGSSSFFSEGGAIHANQNTGENVIVENSVFWGNTAPAGPQLYFSASGDTIDNSCIEGGFAGTNNENLTVDPFAVVGDRYYLNATGGGGALCTDNGSNTAADAAATGYPLTGYDWRDLTTRSDGATETDVDGGGSETVDAGVHYVP